MSGISDFDGEMDNLVCDCLFDLKNQAGTTEEIIRCFQRNSMREAVDAFKAEAMKAINRAMGVIDALESQAPVGGGSK